MRGLIAAERPLARMPIPVKPQFTDVQIAGALVGRPTLYDVGSSLIPLQEAANFFSGLTFESAALERQKLPRPEPKVASEP